MAKVHCKAFEDNSGTLETAKVHKCRPRMKHLNVRLHHFGSHVDDGAAVWDDNANCCVWTHNGQVIGNCFSCWAKGPAGMLCGCGDALTIITHTFAEEMEFPVALSPEQACKFVNGMEKNAEIPRDHVIEREQDLLSDLSSARPNMFGGKQHTHNPMWGPIEDGACEFLKAGCTLEEMIQHRIKNTTGPTNLDILKCEGHQPDGMELAKLHMGIFHQEADLEETARTQDAE